MRALTSLLLTGLFTTPLAAQSLTPELLEAVRLGPARADLHTPTVTVPIAGRPTLPLLETMINGTGPWRLLVDLGSNVTILRRSVADSAGVAILLERSTTDIIRIDSLSIGGAVFREVSGATYDTLDVDGVLGYNLLDAFPFTMDYPGMTFTFRQTAEPDMADLDLLPFRLDHRLPYIWVGLGPDSLLLNFDTGAAQWMSVPESWEDQLPFRETPASGPTVWNNQTGRRTVRSGVLGTPVTLGRYDIEDVEVLLTPDADDGWLGSALLQQFVLTFYPDRRLVRVTRGGR